MMMVAESTTFRGNIIYTHEFSATDSLTCVLHVVLGLKAISNEIITLSHIGPLVAQ